MHLFFLSLAGGLLVLDTTAVLQILISQPLVSCTILGWMANDTAFGLHFGLLMQLLWVSQLPVGAARVAAGNLGSITGVLIALQLKPLFPEYQNFLILAGLLSALIISYIGAHLNAALNQFNVTIFNRIFNQIEKGKISAIGRMTAAALAVKLALLTLLIYGFVIIGVYVLQFIKSGELASINTYARYIEMAVIGAGIGLTLNLYKSRKAAAVFIAGIILGILIFLI